MNSTFQYSKEEFIDTVLANVSLENRIEALKSLAILLLREVESLQNYSNVGNKQKYIDQINLYDEVQRFEADLIHVALIQTNGHQRQAAKMLGIKVTTLNSKIKRYGIVLLKNEYQ